MNATAMCIAFVLLLPAAALVIGVWWSMAEVEDEMRAFNDGQLPGLALWPG